MTKFWHAVESADKRFPLIAVGALLGLAFFTGGQYMGWHFHHFVHHKITHVVTNEVGMLFFFAYLGLEIKIRTLKQAGRFAGLAALGGILVPPLVCYALVQNWFLAIGAMATDVAFSIGALNLRRNAKVKLLLMGSALLILAVGDDLGGVGVAAGVFADNVDTSWLVGAGVLLVICYFLGERGKLKVVMQEVERPETRGTYEAIIVITRPSFWLMAAIINTWILHKAGVEWMLGPCLVFILAPQSIKERFIKKLEPIIPLILLAFGFTNAGIDLLNAQSWGWITAGCFLGGMFGKQIGIFAGGVIGRAWTRRATKKSRDIYSKTPLGQIYGLALFGSVNGTVAIFFVSLAFAQGHVTKLVATQAILGFFLTVPAVYIQTLLFGRFIKEDPAFQEEEPHRTPIERSFNGSPPVTIRAPALRPDSTA